MALDLKPVLDIQPLDLQPADAPEVPWALRPENRAVQAQAQQLSQEGIEPGTDFLVATHGHPIAAPLNALLEEGGTEALNTIASDLFGKQPFKPGQPSVHLPGSEGQGVIPALERGVEGFTTPGNLAALPFAPESKLLQAGFAGNALSSIPDAIGKVAQAQTPQEAKDAAAELGLNVAMAALMRKGFTDTAPRPENAAQTPPRPAAPPINNIGDKFGSVLDNVQVPGKLMPRKAPVKLDLKPVEETPPNITPDKLQPALLVNGKPVTLNEPEATHDKIYNAEVEKAKAADDKPLQTALHIAKLEDNQHVFVDDAGKVYSRDEASKALGQTEPLHSEILNELKAKQPKPAPTPPPERIPTSIKNEVVDEERKARGLPAAVEPAKRSFGTVWDTARAKTDADPRFTSRPYQRVTPETPRYNRC